METDMPQHLKVIEEEALAEELPLAFKVGGCVVLVVIGLLSAFLLSGIFSSPDTYEKTIASLDSKKDTVLVLTAASAGASAALSAIPDDTCTPLAEKLADLSSDFLVVLTAIYLEKYLLTTFGFVSFAVLIPVSCILGIVALLIRGRPGLRRPVARLAEKLALLGIALVLTVPASVLVSDRIEATYQDSIDKTVEAAQITAKAAEETTEETKQNEATNPLEFFQQRVQDLANAAGDVANSLGGAVEWVQGIIGNFLEAAAVMIVISCIIPILVLVFFLWIVKLILGVNVEAPMGMLRPNSLGRMARRG